MVPSWFALNTQDGEPPAQNQRHNGGVEEEAAHES